MVLFKISIKLLILTFKSVIKSENQQFHRKIKKKPNFRLVFLWTVKHKKLVKLKQL